MSFREMLDVAGGWGNLAVWGINAFLGWVIWSLRRQFATREEVKQMTDELRELAEAQDRRLIVVEQAISGIPGKIDRMSERVAAQEATLEGIAGQIKLLSQQVNMLLRHQMENGRT
jgi:hypothetical protein